MAELVQRLVVEGSRIEVEPSSALRRFVTAPLFWEYPGLDVEALPQHVAILPFTWAVAPIVWATNVEGSISGLDAKTVDSLTAVRSELRLAYPELPWAGSIHSPLDGQTPAAEGGGLQKRGGELTEAALFSGGLDSTYTALAHAGPQLLLVAAWGADIGVGDDERWRRHAATIGAFAASHAGGLQVVRTNARAAMDYRRLNGIAAGIGRWWVDVQFGTTLTGLAAPILALHGIRRIYLSSGARWDSQTVLANGSSPRLDNSIDFGFARVQHFGNDMSRQDKINWLVAGGHVVPLRVCIGKPSGSEMNCERCIKCLRTIASVVVAGGDPTRFGFPRYTPATLELIPRLFEQGKFHFGWAEAAIWEDLRDNRKADAVIDPSFLAWLNSFDFAAYGKSDLHDASRSRAFVRRARGAAPWLAPLVAPLRGLRSLRRFLP